MVDERTERLITRKLDGELSESESLELDKLLIRDPQSRAILEQQQRLDALARDTLHESLGQEPGSRDTLGHEANQPARFTPRADRAARMTSISLSVATAAAALMLVVLAGQLLWPVTHREPPTVANSGSPHAPSTLVRNTPSNTNQGDITEPGSDPIPAMPVGYPGIRDVVGVLDEETESLYLLEIPRPVTSPQVRVSY